VNRMVWWLCALVLAALIAPARAAEGANVFVLRIAGAIGPATAEYVGRSLDHAARERAQLVVLEIDTPGGLDTSMRSIIKDIVASPVPVAAYVAPQGARAASAGTYILYAAHIAAMAPATNLGAATPIAIGIPTPGREPEPPGRPASAASAADTGHDTSSAKRINDAAAYIRSLAQLRGRNAEWGEQAVREAVSLSATDALKLKVIDIVAQDVTDLLRKAHGRKIAVQGVERTLETAGAATLAIAPDWRSELLAVIANPSVALILMMIGIYGLLFEFSNPGYRTNSRV